MKCLCGAEMEMKRVDHTRRWGKDGNLVRVTHVPAWVCPECGERVFEHHVAQKVAEIVRDASRTEQQRPEAVPKNVSIDK